ncbi:MAG TPA: hypothetical protein VK973_00850 [Arenicellales bacterium]|nr:hypothetical protein [Arenicellales bacterium]
MAKSKSGGVPTTTIRLGGSKYTLRLSFAAFAEVERRTRVNMLTTPLHRLNVEQLTTLVWAAIEHKGEPKDKISIQEVQELMGPHNTRTIQQAVIDAVNESLPDSDPEEDAETAEGNESAA